MIIRNLNNLYHGLGLDNPLRRGGASLHKLDRK